MISSLIVEVIEDFLSLSLFDLHVYWLSFWSSSTSIPFSYKPITSTKRLDWTLMDDSLWCSGMMQCWSLNEIDFSFFYLQAPWLIYTVTTICRRNGAGTDSDYLYKYPRPVPQSQLLTFSLTCWSHLLFLFLIQHQSNVVRYRFDRIHIGSIIFFLFVIS